MTTQEILNRLSEGNSRFVSDRLKGDLLIQIKKESLLNTQKPFAIVLSCADSRVVPELIFETGIGDLFVVRVAGNVANTSSIASIEYAVAHLKTKVIVVLGHQNCGAVTVASKGRDYGKNINRMISLITPAISASREMATIDELALKNAELSAKALTKKSKIIKNAVENEGVKIVSAFYWIESGKVDFGDVR
ncbi:hypothetical protein N9164_05520 [Draconibacterium sp.]|nr:hypothetical protein [Draconibacterium sp.]